MTGVSWEVEAKDWSMSTLVSAFFTIISINILGSCNRGFIKGFSHCIYNGAI